MQTLRTPDDRFADLPGFPYEPRYATTSDGLRMAYVDEGAGPVVLLLHGEPSWSYLYRTMIPVLVDAGFRCVAPDLIGFGRSDKPLELGDYTYARHVEWLRSVLFDALDLTDVTLVCQDWGGLLGLRLVAEAESSGQGDRFARVCAANTGLPDGRRRLPDAWWQFRDFVVRTEDLPIGFLVASGCAVPMAPEVQAAYDAPFPDAAHKAGPRAFPDLIPQDADNPATADNQRAWEVLEAFEKPFLCAFSDLDPITGGGERMLIGKIPGAAGQPHTTITGGGHFLQEDRGPELARVVADWAVHGGARA
ncbi:MAG: haloalkane dehalogenase [Frankiales bacterium]|nr:haloalkane dehalogenase [Frankiales bacterium]